MKEAALILFLRFLALLPLSAARASGALLGGLCWSLQTRMARTTLTNLALCFPGLNAPDRRKLAQASLQQTFQTITEAGAVWLWPPARILSLVTEVEGLGLLQSAKAENKGVLLVAPHMGNWELLGLYLNVCGCGPSSQLYQAPDSPALAKLIFTARSRMGAKMVATDNKGVGELLKSLRAGEIVGILPDQVPLASGGEFAPFFGKPAFTMTLLNRLQQKTGARVVVGYAKRVEHGFRMIFREPAAEIYASDLTTALAALNRSVESVVLEDPAQYQWEYKRFKRQPQGVQPPY
ncbi:MAG: lysophospholipid acyltransferase family protein [Gammaproteobacteria bacterium]|jgi:KDO2-lipid IV(A) lauroyltransferase